MGSKTSSSDPIRAGPWSHFLRSTETFRYLRIADLPMCPG